MSEAQEAPQELDPRAKAIAYIQERDAKRAERIKVGGLGVGGARKLERSDVEVSYGTAYERVLGRLDDNGLRRVMEEIRPTAYDLARLSGYGAAAIDTLVTGALIFRPETFGDRIANSRWARVLGVAGMWKFRPARFIASRGLDVAGVVGAEVAGVVNNIIGRKPEVPPVPSV